MQWKQKGRSLQEATSFRSQENKTAAQWLLVFIHRVVCFLTDTQLDSDELNPIMLHGHYHIINLVFHQFHNGLEHQRCLSS